MIFIFVYLSIPWLLHYPIVAYFFYALISLFGLTQFFKRRPTITGVGRLAEPRSVRVTFVIPIYNEAENLPALLENLRVNQHPAVSYLFINDASTDNSADIIAAQGFPVHTVVKQPYVCDVLNIGAIMAPEESNFIGVLNGDCLLAPDAIAKMMGRLQWYDLEVLNMSNHALPGGTFFAHLEKKFKKELYIYCEASLTNGYVLRRTLLNQGWSTITEDLNLTLQLKAKGGLTIHQDPAIIVYDRVPSCLKTFFRQKYRWVYGDLSNRFVHRPKNAFDLIVNIYYFFPFYAILSLWLPCIPTATVLQIQGGIIALEILLYLHYIGNMFEALLYGPFQFLFQVYFYFKMMYNWLNGKIVVW